MVKVIVAETKLDCEHLLGQFLDENHYDTLIDEDCDFYAPTINCDVNDVVSCVSRDCGNCEKGADESTIIFKLRKNFFTIEEQLGALDGLREAATQSQNRGVAAGPRGEKLQGRDWVSQLQLDVIDYFLMPTKDIFGNSSLDEILSKKYLHEEPTVRGFVWLTNRVKENNFVFDEWVEETKKLSQKEQKEEAIRVRKYISDTNYAAPVFSGVAGWFDRYPRIPYGRATSYTEKNFEKFKLAYPFLQSLSKAFSELLPKRYAYQKSCADRIDPEFHVPGTPFTTITVNKSFRTAAHRDAGDLHEGFSNLSVLTNGKRYSGGMLVLPEFKVAVNIRPGDLLLINNHFGIHGNTPIVLDEEGAERYSVVCYFREKMLELGSKEYEDSRYNFVESRRLNKDHPEWRELWNGVSTSMWNSKEWIDYLLSQKNGKALVDQYHNDLYNSFYNSNSVEDFF